MAQRFIEPIARIFTNAGAVGVGYKYYFYQTGTTTPVTTYQNAGLTVANTNPVLSDANGRFPEIWYSDLSQLKLIVKDSSNNTIETVDPVGATSSAVSLNDFDVRPTSYWGLTAGTSTAYTLVANPTISAYANTQTFVVQVHVDCGASPTLAIDGLSALNWKKYTQQGTKVAMKANDLRATQRYFCINDGVDIVCLNPNSLPMLSGSNTALTIATGAVTLTNNSSSYAIDTEGAATTDDLNTINGGQDGQVIVICSTNSARVIRVIESGNIDLANDLSCHLINAQLKLGLRYNSTTAKWEEIFRSGDPMGQALITYVVSSGTDGGGSTAAAWITRPLNTINYDYGDIITSLSSNQFIIKQGEYRFTSYQVLVSAASAIDDAKGRIRDITNSATVVASLNSRHDTEAGVFNTHVVITAPVIYGFTTSTTLELQYYVDAALATTGLGAAASTGEVEIYAFVFIEKIG